jgi:immunity protein Imm1 of predicted polymorphic toxin system
MRLTLDAWYYRDDNRADKPVAVRSALELEALIAYLVTHAQPHPTVFSARELPTVGPLDDPDRMFKLDVADEVGALAYLGPDVDVVVQEREARRTRPTDHSELWNPGMWTTLAEEPPADAPPLYIDKANRTPFPSDAALPLGRIREALAEFAETGQRPRCVQWQDSDVF